MLNLKKQKESRLAMPRQKRELIVIEESNQNERRKSPKRPKKSPKRRKLNCENTHKQVQVVFLIVHSFFIQYTIELSK
eukprot:m.55522 g.55522  ORF g.55522 m.55522 type:complete len:78 (-) comp22090_c0_seq1:21-254(-)